MAYLSSDRRTAVILLLLVGGVTACGVAAADGHPTTTEHPTTTVKHTTTTDKYTTTTKHETTTTKHETTTTKHETTTTKKPRETTTTVAQTTTTKPGTTTTTLPGTTTTFPTPTPFGIQAVAACPNGEPVISITFGNRPDLDGQTGTLSFSTGSPSVPLVFQSNTTVLVPWPAGDGDIALLTYTLGAETETAGPLAFPEGCEATTTTTGPTTSTTTTLPGTTTTSLPPTTTSTTTSSTVPSTTTTAPGTTTTTLPPPFAFGGAATVCVREVPTIQIDFQNTFPELAGETGVLTMSDINGNVVSTQDLVYEPNTTVRLLYPGTRVNPDGSIADVPGWILNEDGLWVRDPTDDYLRDGIGLEYTVNPTATAFVTYPPESSECANPENTTTTTTAVQPTTTVPPGQPTIPPGPGLPSTGSEDRILAGIAFLMLAAGTMLVAVGRRRTH